MSTAPSSSVPLPTSSEHKEKSAQEFCKNLVPTLPREKWFGSIHLCQYNGFWFEPCLLPRHIAFRNQFQAQDTDVLLITTPKSGTTWLKALMFTLLNRKIHPVNQKYHPLIKENPHTLVPFVDVPSSPTELNPDFSCLSRGRLYATHYPISLLPESVRNSGCKIVYLCRNVKDTFVSFWHFMNALFSGSSGETSLEEFFDLFCKGVSLYGPIWDHALDYWKASLDKPEKVFFLKYEELTQEPASWLKLLAEFMGCPISQEEEAAGLVDEILELCSFDHLRNLEVNKSGAYNACSDLSNQAFFRKGKVGDWKNYLTSEMVERIDQISAQKSHGSGLIL